jgi:hypothetical protein
MSEPLVINPRLLLHVGLGLGRLAPLAERMEIALAVRSAVDDGDDVVAGPGIARAEEAAAAVDGIAAAVVALEDPEPHAGRHRGVGGQADPLRAKRNGQA